MPKKERRLADWLALSQLLANVDSCLEEQLKSEAGLALNEFYVLYFLSVERAKKMRLQQLQEKMPLSQSALSRLIGRMEDKRCGVIKRHICTDDKRGVYISVTDKGLEKVAAAEQVVDKVLREVFEQHPLLAGFYKSKG